MSAQKKSSPKKGEKNTKEPVNADESFETISIRQLKSLNIKLACSSSKLDLIMTNFKINKLVRKDSKNCLTFSLGKKPGLLTKEN